MQFRKLLMLQLDNKMFYTFCLSQIDNSQSYRSTPPIVHIFLISSRPDTTHAQNHLQAIAPSRI